MFLFENWQKYPPNKRSTFVLSQTPRGFLRSAGPKPIPHGPGGFPKKKAKPKTKPPPPSTAVLYISAFFPHLLTPFLTKKTPHLPKKASRSKTGCNLQPESLKGTKYLRPSPKQLTLLDPSDWDFQVSENLEIFSMGPIRKFQQKQTP